MVTGEQWVEHDLLLGIWREHHGVIASPPRKQHRGLSPEVDRQGAQHAPAPPPAEDAHMEHEPAAAVPAAEEAAGAGEQDAEEAQDAQSESSDAWSAQMHGTPHIPGPPGTAHSEGEDTVWDAYCSVAQASSDDGSLQEVPHVLMGEDTSCDDREGATPRLRRFDGAENPLGALLQPTSPGR